MPASKDPAQIAKRYIEGIAQQVSALKQSIKIVGLIASEDEPSIAYARATKQKFLEIGIEYDLLRIARLDLESTIASLNDDSKVHGIFIYFPVFSNQQDDYLRNLVDFRKDIEAGSSYWTKKLYNNDRLVDNDPAQKAVLPCTPLAIIKMLTELDVYSEAEYKPLQNKVVTIFNRSEVIGRPLAVMMSNDGAEVHSFDENGPLTFVNAKAAESTIDRATALADSDIIITGVPNDQFPKIRANEIPLGSVCINFSSVPNFADDIETHADIYVPRVGPMTVAMCMRNTLRLYQNFHLRDET